MKGIIEEVNKACNKKTTKKDIKIINKGIQEAKELMDSVPVPTPFTFE